METNATAIKRLFYIKRDKNIFSYFNYFLIFLVILILIGLLLFKIHQDANNKQKNDVALVAEGVQKGIEFRLKGNLEYLKLLASERAEGNLKESGFQGHVHPFLAIHPEYINITWVDSSFVIKTVSPLQSNRNIIGLSIKLPEPARVSKIAKEKRASVYTKPFEAIQSKTSFEVWVPVFDGKKFLGFFTGVYSCNDLLKVCLPQSGIGNSNLYIIGRNGTELAAIKYFTGSEGFSATIALSPVESGMFLKVSKRTSHTASWAMFFVVLIITILLVSISYFLRKIKKQNSLRMVIENSLRKERNFLNMIMETSPGGITMTDKVGNIIYANRKAEEILELSHKMEHPLQYNSPEFKITGYDGEPFPDEDLPFNRIKTNLKPVNEIHHAITMKTGERKMLSINAVPILNLQGELDGMVAVIEDCTERLRAEKVLHESEQMFKSFFEQASVGVAIVDAKNGHILKANRKYCSILGYTEDEIQNLRFLDLTHPEDIRDSKQIVDDLLAGKIHEFSMEKRYVRKDRQVVWAILTVSPMWESNDQYRHNIAIIQDITERKRSEATMMLKDDLIRMTGEMAKVGGWEFDPLTGEGTWTDEVARIHDLDPEQDTSMQLGVSFYTPESKQKIESAIREVIQKGTPYDLELELISSKGVKKWIRTIGFPVMIENKIDKIRGIFQDITERKNSEQDLIEAKEKAMESDRLKTVFLQNMSHEIRTPMNAIMGFSDLLAHNLGNEKKLIHFSEIIKQRSADLLGLINDILDLSKIDSGQLPLNVEECNLNKFLRELLEIFMYQREKLNKENIQIQFKDVSGLKDNTVIVDTLKLKQVFINLVNNALKFTDEGHIEFGYELNQEGKIVFFVADTGIGIPQDKQSFVFERFAQLKQNQSAIYSGTGLGLSIVKGLIELMGGKIWLLSEPGKGSTFYFSIEYKVFAAGTRQDPKLFTVIGKSLKGKKLLLVEDDEYNLEYIQEVLSNTGIEIFVAKTGHESIRMIREIPEIEIILMDINLPGMDGFEASREIKKVCPDVKIIAQTAYATVEDKEKSYACGCIDFLSKPIKKEVLLEKIKEHLQ